MTSVKNMPRKQQQAVFASMGKGSDRSTVRGMQQKREQLLRNNLIEDSHQDKVDRIMQNKRLTHRQKMDRIAKLKNTNPRTSSSRPSTGVDSPGVKTIYVKTLEKAEERRQARKEYRRKHPNAKFMPTSKPGVYILKEDGRMYEWKGTGEKKLLKTSLNYDTSAKKEYRVFIKSPEVGTMKSEIVKTELMTKKDAEKFALEKRKLGWSTARSVKVDIKKLNYSQLKKGGHKFIATDADGDGVPNSKDCRPLDKNKQDIEKTASKVYKAFQKSRTPEARIKRAKTKIKQLEDREKAEKIEREAQEKEAAYKKAHPKRFGIF